MSTTEVADTRSSATSVPAVRTHVIEPPKRVPRLGFGELRETGDLLRLLVVKEIRLRYVGTVLGPFWIVANPLVPALLFTFVFTRIVQVDTGQVSYLLMVTSALVPWATVNRTLLRGGGCLVNERSLLSKVYFPRVLLVLSVLVTSLIDFAVSLAIAMMSHLGGGGRLSVRLIAIPGLLVWTMALSFALVTLAAGLSVYRRDVLYVIPMFTQVWLYISPVMYPASALPAGVRQLSRLNPMATMVQAYQWAITGQTSLSLTDLVIAVVLTALATTIGMFAFATGQRSVADII